MNEVRLLSGQSKSFGLVQADYNHRSCRMVLLIVKGYNEIWKLWV